MENSCVAKHDNQRYWRRQALQITVMRAVERKEEILAQNHLELGGGKGQSSYDLTVACDQRAVLLSLSYYR